MTIAAESHGEKAVILVVDDTPDNLTLMSGLLKDLYKVKVANSGERALKIAQSEAPPDLILLDIMMPEMDGYEVCRRLKTDLNMRDIPIIFLTAKSEVDDETKGLALGAVDYITKPISPPIVLARVKTHLAIKQVLKMTQDKLGLLVENCTQMATEPDRDKLLRQIMMDSKVICNCDAATMYLKTDHDTLLMTLRSMSDDLPTFEIPLHDIVTGEPNDSFMSARVANHNESIIIDDVYAETRFDVNGPKLFDKESGYRSVSMLTIPMSPRQNEVIGVLQFVNALSPDTGEIIPFKPEIVHFVEALAAQAAVALENFNLLDAQKALMDSMIRIIAGAIDAKSPYTGGHCERVPELAIMLAQKACEVTEGPLADFNFNSQDEWNEFRIGAWLHDCGKVTTPEYVVDKATKLEIIFNRIHEIRTRFEVLLRDAKIECLQSKLNSKDIETAEANLASRKQQLIEDFTFIAECNIGGEFMSPDRIERLQQIGTQIWMRHFDDRIGLSGADMQRLEGIPAAPLPVVESLLADKPEHIIPRALQTIPSLSYGFKMKVPENLYNYGEIYNLRLSRGTLTEEERYKINEHIVQTIIMLETMPFPKKLQRVPEYAGTHHETLTGTGYPRKLTMNELSVPSRIMAVADIFEALTASDRPYKKVKPLSEAVDILAKFKQDQHIDPDLFDLFLRSGLYLEYAKKYLLPEQIDEVNVDNYLK